MKAAIESSGGVPGVVVTLATVAQQQSKKAVTWDGISFVNNIQYESDALRVWKPYNTRPGKLVPWTKFDVSIEDLPVIADHGNEHSTEASFVPLKPRKIASLAKTAQFDGNDNGNDSGDGEEGCVRSYQRHSSFEQHIQCGKHKRALEQETLLDRAMVKYGSELEKGASKISELSDETYLMSEASSSVHVSPLCMGWALRGSFTRKTRFNLSQKE